MGTPESFRALLVVNKLPQRIDFTHRTRNLCENVNEFLYKSAHEPSLASHRIQEHVYKTVPSLVNCQATASSTTHKMNGVLFDLDYTTEFLNKLDDSIQNSAEARESVSSLASKISAATSRAINPPGR